jgi:mono/diheme cytochrome c family protein
MLAPDEVIPMRRWPLLLLTACTNEPEPGPLACLDLDADLVCDHERADWSANASVPPGEPRTDVFALGEDLPDIAYEGMVYASAWPVDVSGVLVPYEPLERFFSAPTEDPVITSFRAIVASQTGSDSLDGLFGWLGMPRLNSPDAVGPYLTPYPEGFGEGDRMGVTRLPTPHGDALTFSCAGCHAAPLFGRTVVGLTNRRARANSFFHLGIDALGVVDDEVFVQLTGATEEELKLLQQVRERSGAIGVKVPEALGLDTSLAQVALSLARRAEDPYATRDAEIERSPRPNALSEQVSDSKPMVWWTLKYKTRWLSDGSIVSGNPVFTNFLWNELGRGTDLDALEDWLIAHPREVDTLTAAIFATEPPRWTDYFPAETIDEAAAQRGQLVFEAHCATCHGSYDKGWDAPDAATRTAVERLQTTEVRYHTTTPVIDVGTDPLRHQGMQHFADRLNELAISQWMQTVVEPQQGYVPPPLDGIWARYPYLHNNAVPTLCDLLSPGEQRTEVFYQGPSDDPETDFDAACVGYPTGDAVPESWRTEDAKFDTRGEGMSRLGHDAMLVDAEGEEILGEAEKADLIVFLKTL